jgi:hypothetical protein
LLMKRRLAWSAGDPWRWKEDPERWRCWSCSGLGMQWRTVLRWRKDFAVVERCCGAAAELRRRRLDLAALRVQELERQRLEEKIAKWQKRNPVPLSAYL